MANLSRQQARKQGQPLLARPAARLTHLFRAPICHEDNNARRHRHDCRPVRVCGMSAQRQPRRPESVILRSLSRRMPSRRARRWPDTADQRAHEPAADDNAAVDNFSVTVLRVSNCFTAESQRSRTERTLTEKAIAWRTLHRYRLIPVKSPFRFCPPGPFVSTSRMYAPARAAVGDSGSPLPHAGNRNKPDAMAEAIASELFAACFMHWGRRSR